MDFSLQVDYLNDLIAAIDECEEHPEAIAII
jgi:hypothetical protein